MNQDETLHFRIVKLKPAYLATARLQGMLMASNEELTVKLGLSLVVAKCPERDRKQH